jgi:hypothetical protein
MTPWLLVLLAQVSGPPALPLGSSPEFQRTAAALADATQKGDWAEASRLATRLPNPQVMVTWDDSAVPANLRPIYAAARDQAIKEWADAVPEIKIQVGPRGDIQIGFSETLPPPPDSVVPAAAVCFVSDSPEEPRVEAVVAMKRGTPPLSALAVSVRNEVGYVIGAYFGLSRWPRGGSFMSRTDSLVNVPLKVAPEDARIAQANLEFTKAVRASVASKKSFSLARPVLFVNPTQVTLDPLSQGEVLKSNFEISNQGDGALEYFVAPDCGCISPIRGGTVQPGSSVVVPILADTSEFPGPFEKGLYVYTNDPESPVRKLRVSSYVTPAYRFLAEESGRGIVVGDSGARLRVYLVYDPARPFQIKSVDINGVLATAEFKPWRGEIADPGLQEGARAREGYQIDIMVAPNVPEGRNPMTLIVATDLEARPVLRHTVNVQKGIVASPPQVYFGTVDPARRQAWVMVGRPGRPFKITRVRSDSPFVSAQSEAVRPDEHRILVTVLNSAPSGSIDALVEVTTDDAEQQTIPIRVAGTVP